MKRILSFCSALLLLVTLSAGCGSDKADPTATTTAGDDTVTTTTLAVSADPTTTNSDKPAGTTASSSVTTKATTASSCNHAHTEIVSVNTGKHMIDSSKLDMLYHAVKCKDCQQQVRLEKHTVTAGKCTVCGQSNFEMAETGFIETTYFDKDGTEQSGINDDGSFHYSAVLDDSYYLAELSKNKTDAGKYKIPEATMFDAINRVFVFSKSEFEKLKAQGTYTFLQGEQTYQDGYFYIDSSNDGGRYQYIKTPLGYTDDQKGTFTIYLDFLKKDTSEHQFYYAITYRYEGTASNLYLQNTFGTTTIFGWEPLVSSLKVTAVKKVAAPDPAMKAPEVVSFDSEY